jgi:menaquinone-dependent protoporphyrinogen IX oxidase
MSKTLIAYGTRYGATAKSSEVIAKVLKEKYNHEVDVVDLKKKKEELDLSDYDNIIVGSSIAKFSWTGNAKKFLKNDFSEKKLFVFITSAGITYPALERGDTEKYEKWKYRFLDRVVKKNTNVQPLSTAVFGGWIKSGNEKSLDNWKEIDAINWADKIGNM